MTQNMLLMCGDIPVLEVNFDDLLYNVLDERLLPHTLKGSALEPPYAGNSDNAKYVATQMVRVAQHNSSSVINWCGNRALSLSRKNAKWLYNLLRIDQLSDNQTKAKIAVICRAVSVLDNYWLKLANDNSRWSDMNVRRNSLNEIVAQIALHGASLTLQGSMCTPEFTTNGAYAKAWRRRDDNLWLAKIGENGESRVEAMCSNILDKLTVDHCHYEMGEDNGVPVCLCPCMATDELSIISGLDFISYCHKTDIDPDREMMRIDADGIYRMWIVDYLISNRDRHGQNWGFYYDSATTEIVRCHPLFDHNNAFDTTWVQDPNAKYQFGDMTIREAAKYAMTKVLFGFTTPVTREDFITERQYQSFCERANDLGISMLDSVQLKVWNAMKENDIHVPLQDAISLLPAGVEMDDEMITSCVRELR